MKYFDELKRSMEMLAKYNDTIFMGQSVVYPGTGMFETLTNIPSNIKYEMPVAENLQMGMSIGLSLTGKIPISIYPRWNFLLSATDQIVNHLDKLSIISNNKYQPKIIIRVGVGSEKPLHPQHQHIGDFTDGFKLMCKNVEIIRLDETEQIFSSYEKAYLRKDGKSTIVVEWMEYYNKK